MEWHTLTETQTQVNIFNYFFKKYSVLAKTLSFISPLPKVHYISPGQLSSPWLMDPGSVTISIWGGFGGRGERQRRTSYRFVNTATWNEPQHRLSGHIMTSPNDIATSKSEVDHLDIVVYWATAVVHSYLSRQILLYYSRDFYSVGLCHGLLDISALWTTHNDHSLFLILFILSFFFSSSLFTIIILSVLQLQQSLTHSFQSY